MSTTGLPLLDSVERMQAWSRTARSRGQRIAFVPTMGALHEGHVALMHEAHRHADRVVVSIFVNPLQFGPGEDYSRYPRTLEADRDACAAAGVHALFVPDAAGMYPLGFQTGLRAGPLARRLEGRHRPGHFDGMLTVVAKLFALVQPDVAVFGEKDYQQLLLVRRMVQDLHIPVEVVGLPIVREADGLARSSRNRYLSAGARARAVVLSRAIEASQRLAAAGERSGKRLLEAARAICDAERAFETQYVALVDPQTLAPLRWLEREGRLLIAGHLGKRPRVRLIDNGPLHPRGE